jgi:hypothetical protein
MEGKVPSGSAPACAQGFVYPVDWKIKQAFSQTWKGKLVPGASWARQKSCLVEILRAAGSRTANDEEKFP